VPHIAGSLTRTNIYLSRPQKLALDDIARVTGLPVSEHVRRAVDAYLRDWADANPDLAEPPVAATA
jgi:hypothetical protein